MSHRPDDRYQNASDLRTELQGLANRKSRPPLKPARSNEPGAPPRSPGEIGRRKFWNSGRDKYLVAGAILIVATLVAAVWLKKGNRSESDQADTTTRVAEILSLLRSDDYRTREQAIDKVNKLDKLEKAALRQSLDERLEQLLPADAYDAWSKIDKDSSATEKEWTKLLSSQQARDSILRAREVLRCRFLLIETEARAKCLENLNQFGLALHSYSESYGKLPSDLASLRDFEEESRSAWVENLLPLMEQQPLYDRVDLNKTPNDPWGSTYRYETDSPDGKSNVYSNGPGGLPNTDDDIKQNDEDEEKQGKNQEEENEHSLAMQQLRDQLAKIRVFLAAQATTANGLDELSELASRDDLPREFEGKVLELLNQQTGRTAQLWLLARAENKHHGKWAAAEYAAFELFCLWYAYRVVGEQDEARKRLDTALKNISRMGSAESATSAASEIAGWLVNWKQDEDAVRALKLAVTAAPEATHSSETYVYCYLGGMARMMSRDETAEELHERARGLQSQVWMRDHVDAWYFATAREFQTAMPALERYNVPLTSAVVAIAAAVANREADYVKAKRLCLNKIPGWEKTRGENMDGVRTYLLCADATMGEFDTAELQASSLPANWQGFAYSILAREYALAGKTDDAKVAFEKATLSAPAVEAALYLTRQMIRDGESLSTVYRYANRMGSDCIKLVAMCGIVAGLNEDLPIRHQKHFSFW